MNLLRGNAGRIVGVMLAVAATAVALAWMNRDPERPSAPPNDTSDLRMPVPNPVIEPDRPDLLAEPRIEQPAALKQE